MYNFHCEVLELLHPFIESDLKLNYHRLMKLWHPDKHASDPTKVIIAHQKTVEINAAYEFISEIIELKIQAGKSTAGGFSNDNYNDYKTKHTYQTKTFTAGFPDLKVIEIFLKSSHIISAGYDKVGMILYIKFSGNVVYAYFNVPEMVYTNFLSAESYGKYAHRNIYQVYRQKNY